MWGSSVTPFGSFWWNKCLPKFQGELLSVEKIVDNYACAHTDWPQIFSASWWSNGWLLFENFSLWTGTVLEFERTHENGGCWNASNIRNILFALTLMPSRPPILATYSINVYQCDIEKLGHSDSFSRILSGIFWHSVWIIRGALGIAPFFLGQWSPGMPTVHPVATRMLQTVLQLGPWSLRGFQPCPRSNFTLKTVVKHVALCGCFVCYNLSPPYFLSKDMQGSRDSIKMRRETTPRKLSVNRSLLRQAIQPVSVLQRKAPAARPPRSRVPVTHTFIKLLGHWFTRLLVHPLTWKVVHGVTTGKR